MTKAPFYKEHWVAIDAERLERYQRMFGWNPASKPLYDLANIVEGHIVADFGCGPGHTAVEIAQWVGPTGHVHALDINQAFIEQCHENARAADLSDRISPHLVDGTRLPFDADTLDRITARNTLIYVDDPLETLKEIRRVLRPGGKVHAIEGDWPMMVAEPIPAGVWTALTEAAGVACRTPDIGRRLPGLLTEAGFRSVEIEVITRPDLDGRLLPMVQNMAGYAKSSNQMSVREIDGALETLNNALVENNYLVLAPQFVVAAKR